MTTILVHKITITGPEGFHLEHELHEGITILGRQPTDGITLPNARVSRNHAQLELAKGEVQVMDLGSSNGTILNDESLFPKIATPLLDGDVVLIDPFRIEYHRVQVEKSEEAPPPLPVEKASPPAEAVAKEPPPVTLPPEAAPPKEKAPAAEKPAPAKTPAAPLPAAPKAPAPPAEKPAPKGAPKKEAGGPPPAPPAGAPPLAGEPASELVPPGMTIYSQRLIEYLPGIYHTDFLRRFLGIFESIWMPIEWTVDNFDLFLSPGTAPEEFIPWLAGWYDIVFDSTWTVEQRRELLRNAAQLFSRRGTRWALTRILEIYTGAAPEIIDTGDKLEPHTFLVRLKSNSRPRELVQALIDSNKPAHTAYKLE